MSFPKKSTIIVAYDKNRGIGLNNDLPWPKNKRDMDHFMLTTRGHTVIMGRKTWESIPEKYRPLPHRTNVVVSRTLTDLPNAFVCKSLEEAVKKSGTSSFVIGGAQIYREALEKDLVDEIIATEFQQKYEADTFFPELPEGWNPSGITEDNFFRVAYYKKP